MSKYALTELITSLNKDEIRNFKIYINRIHFQQDKKLERLFDLIKSSHLDEYGDEIVEEVGAKNKNNYYRLKNRLIEELEYSLLILHRAKDDSFRINNGISLARIFAYKTNYSQALKYLLKAEKEALKLEHYDVLNVIYDRIIELSTLYRGINTSKYVALREKNNDRYQKLQRLNTMVAVVTNQLANTNFSGKDKEVINTLNQIINQLELTEYYHDSPKVQFTIYNCVKGILLQKKEFIVLEKYLTNTFQDFNKRKLFNKANHQEKIVMLVWIINTLTKNMEFNEALVYHEQLKEELYAFDKLHFQKYQWTFYQNKFVLNVFVNQLDKAIEVLHFLNSKEEFKNLPSFNLVHYLNLATVYFYKKDYKVSITHITPLIATEKFNQLSEDWKLHVSIVELIIRVEVGDFEYVSYRVKNIRKMFRKMFSKEEYQTEKEFLSIILKIVQQVNPFKQKRLQKAISIFIGKSPSLEIAGNEAINYSLWLQSKLEGKGYFQLLLELISVKSAKNKV